MVWHTERASPWLNHPKPQNPQGKLTPARKPTERIRISPPFDNPEACSKMYDDGPERFNLRWAWYDGTTYSLPNSAAYKLKTKCNATTRTKGAEQTAAKRQEGSM